MRVVVGFVEMWRSFGEVVRSCCEGSWMESG